MGVIRKNKLISVSDGASQAQGTYIIIAMVEEESKVSGNAAKAEAEAVEGSRYLLTEDIVRRRIWCRQG